MVSLSFIVALIGALIATPLIAAVSRRTGRVAKPSPDRWHEKSTALFGGVAIAASFFAALLAGYAGEVSSIWLSAPGLRSAPVIGVVAAAFVMFASGFADDLLALRPPTKLVLQVAAAAVLVGFGATLQVTPWIVVNALITFFWFVAVTNALNLLDNMDGVAAGAAAIAAAGFAMVFAIEAQPVLAGLSLALAAACAGFLPYNFHPARIFMGDSGSLFIGAMLAGLGAAFSASYDGGAHIGLGVPLLLLCVPILDTSLVTYTRLSARQPLAVGGRDHVAHRLARLGLSERFVGLALYAIAALGAVIAVTIAQTHNGPGMLGAAIFGIVAAAFAAYLSRLHTYPAATARPMSKWSFVLEELLYRRRLLEVVFDLVLFGAAYWGALLLRFDGVIPAEQQDVLASTAALAIAAKSVSFMVMGVYRGLWQQVSVADVHRLVRAVALGAVSTAAMVALLLPELVMPRSVFLIDALLVTLFAFGVRLTFRSLDRVRRRLAPQGTPTLIYGAGAAGDIALREMIANPALGFLPIGFLDDDVRKAGVTLQGLTVHFTGGDPLPLLERLQARRVVVATRQLGLPQYQRLRVACRTASVQLTQLRMELVDADGAQGTDLPIIEDRRGTASSA